MVRVMLSLSRERLSLVMQGHAGCGAMGSDLVCAACSILAHTLCRMVQNGVEKGMFYALPTTHISSGNAIVNCTPRAEFYEEMLHAYYMAQVGLSLLQREYPESIELSVVEG